MKYIGKKGIEFTMQKQALLEFTLQETTTQEMFGFGKQKRKTKEHRFQSAL
jgi:nitrogen regulatory protein PII